MSNELLVEAALASDEWAKVAAHAWCSRVDLDSADSVSHDLLPTLGARIVSWDLDVPERAKLAGVFARPGTEMSASPMRSATL